MSDHEDNKAVLRRYIEFWRAGDLSRVDDIIGPGYVGHSSAGERDKDGLVQRIKEFRLLFPDLVYIIRDQVVEGDRVVTRMTAQGRHQHGGELTTLMGINISRVRDGKVIEEWAVWERMSGSFSEYK